MVQGKNHQPIHIMAWFWKVGGNQRTERKLSETPGCKTPMQTVAPTEKYHWCIPLCEWVPVYWRIRWSSQPYIRLYTHLMLATHFGILAQVSVFFFSTIQNDKSQTAEHIKGFLKNKVIVRIWSTAPCDDNHHRKNGLFTIHKRK